MSLVYDEWESENQGRRYPLADSGGDLAPIDLLADLKLGIPSTFDQTRVYVSKVTVGGGRIGVSFKEAATNTIIAWASGTSESYVEVNSQVGVVGSVLFGQINSSDTSAQEFTETLGKLAPEAVYTIPGDATFVVTDTVTELSGRVTIRGGNGIEVTAEDVFDGSERVRSIVIRPSVETNRLVIPSCLAYAEEYWARLGREGILSINNVFANTATGDVDITFSGGLITDAANTDRFAININDTRATMCSEETWTPSSIDATTRIPCYT